MLQQTRVATVVPYFERFLARFPDVGALAAARLEEVLVLWSGLGYYARGHALHAAAGAIVREHQGRFPADADGLARLPGIGPSTAAAIAAFCYDERVAILDGNVKRVLARHFGIDGAPEEAATRRALAERATALLPVDQRDMPSYTQAIMDLGATVCLRSTPRCDACPVCATCHARGAGRTAELPVRRAARSTPVRRVDMLLALHEGRVLLEQRPPAGVWGGLLAPPQFESAPELAAALAALGARGSTRQPPRRFQFTHFTLAYTPHVARVEDPPSSVEEPARRWLALADLEQAPLPAPIRVLLEELRAGEAAGR
jgi:A/G-specific adenine glycosylase